MDSEIVGEALSERKPIPWSLWAVIALGSVVCIAGRSSPIWWAGATILAFSAWGLAQFIAGPPRLLLDARGITRQRRFTPDRHIPWSAIETFSVDSTPPLWVGWRVGLLVALFVMMISGGAASGLPSWDDTRGSSPQIKWRARGAAGAAAKRPARGGWIKGNFGLPQDALLTKLEAWLARFRTASLADAIDENRRI